MITLLTYLRIGTTMASIVHDFTILYSNRVYQKDKKWQDGRLRYYEFNKKIEIYNQEHTVVNTEFYPHLARDPIRHGVFEKDATFIFPSGKYIIEILDYVGCSERDLSKMWTENDVLNVPERSISIKEEPSDVQVSQMRHPPRRRVGLTRKLHPKQMSLTLFMKPATRNMRLEELVKKGVPLGARIPPRSNRHSLRLQAAIGLGERR